MKAVKLLERPQERILQEVHGIVSRAGQAKHRRVEPILVTLDQHPERFGPPRSTVLDEEIFVVGPGHRQPLTLVRGDEFPSDREIVRPSQRLTTFEADLLDPILVEWGSRREDPVLAGPGIPGL